MRTDGRTDRHEEPFRNFANAPKNGRARYLPSLPIGTLAFMKPSSSSQSQETPASFSAPSPGTSVRHVPYTLFHVRCTPQHPHAYVADHLFDHNDLLFQTGHPKISERNPADSPSCGRNVSSYLKDYHSFIQAPQPSLVGDNRHLETGHVTPKTHHPFMNVIYCTVYIPF